MGIVDPFWSVATSPSSVRYAAKPVIQLQPSDPYYRPGAACRALEVDASATPHLEPLAVPVLAAVSGCNLANQESGVNYSLMPNMMYSFELKK